MLTTYVSMSHFVPVLLAYCCSICVWLCPLMAHTVPFLFLLNTSCADVVHISHCSFFLPSLSSQPTATAAASSAPLSLPSLTASPASSAGAPTSTSPETAQNVQNSTSTVSPTQGQAQNKTSPTKKTKVEAVMDAWGFKVCAFFTTSYRSGYVV